MSSVHLSVPGCAVVAGWGVGCPLLVLLRLVVVAVVAAADSSSGAGCTTGYAVGYDAR